MPPVIVFSLNTLKGTAKAPTLDLLRLNTLKSTKTAFLTPKRYDEHGRWALFRGWAVNRIKMVIKFVKLVCLLQKNHVKKANVFAN